ncbi:probable LRR receptor-like serine/threonine-protein kinase At2g16250 [Cynara cardunculus var. scolymus]|uniref:Concanavalin A-like lectin/glucanase, subgroup n=1 Tax=Cynara cardunculus var. scolymus TaxID=59895 RepID=A0A103YCH0_CYNCS|nr:probable LRR receptor-like serine/threonine-protein kinase At2g16250 [Cynara cardunculus var. scolymus]KVI06562.1 Concanavalin A-like lectin/glucanase, subgroup [Cynara cardunculus var. scolymus]
METLLKVIFHFSFFLLLLVNSVLTQVDVRRVPLSSGVERAALLDLRASLGIRARYWPRKSDPCTNWTGLECRNGRVIGINLSGLRRTRSGLLNPGFAIDSLVNCTQLVSFISSGFPLRGSIPDWLGQNLGALQVLDLTSSSVLGPIPPSIGSLNQLNRLVLSNNSLTGIIPDSLGQLSSLSVLNLSHNTLTGSITSSFSALGNLTFLDLSSNFLSGPIPPEFGSLLSLQTLNLSSNSLASSVPAQLGNLSQLVVLDLGSNSLFGSLPTELGGLRRLRRLLIGNNDLGGTFPGNLTANMPDIVLLDLSSNNLTGNLPDLSAFPNASGVTLNFSNNLFYGSLGFKPTVVGSIDLSNNYLQGLESQAGNGTSLSGNCFLRFADQRSLEDCRRFYALMGLPFDGTPNPVQPPSPKKSNDRLKYVLAGVFGGLGAIVIVVIILVLVAKTCNKRNVSQRSANVEPVQEEGNGNAQNIAVNLASLVDSFTYEQMLQATSGFSDANLIKHGHSGDIFSGRLEDGIAVTIKRVDMRTSRKDCYMSELELFSKGMHTRLVPLLGHCLEHETEKLLVYKFMPNGDLSNSLYRSTSLEDDGLQSLDWITRLKIAIGAAEGLSYLHHECNPPMVHRDIQASSILLDDKYDVRLGSLSEVCTQEVDNNQNVITRLLRISSNSEPTPSGSSPPICAYDVYCFGKVLLELVTGKLGISKSEDKEWLDRTLACINNYDKELVSKIVDQSLVIDEDLLEEVWAVAIVAKSCLNPKPAKRPQMTHILKALENPFRVVREEDFSSGRLRNNSSRRSWSTALFGSWRQSFSGSTHSQTNRDGQKQSNSQGSGVNDKRLSSEIFPEPVDIVDVERQDGNR